MSERERWIVYPLLFLALGAALRDKLFDLTRSRNVVCEQFVLIDDGQGVPTRQAVLGVMGPVQPGAVGAVPRGGQLLVDVIRARRIIADRFEYKGIPLVPTLRMFPALTPQERMRRPVPPDEADQPADSAAQQQSEETEAVEPGAPPANQNPATTVEGTEP